MQKNDGDNHSFSCEYCEDKFANLRELMKHKNKQHAENVQRCWNYADGKCEFDDKKC